MSGVDAVVVLQEHCLQYVSVRALLSGVDAVVVLQEHCLQYVSWVSGIEVNRVLRIAVC